MSDGNGEGDDARGSNLMDLTGAPGVEFLSPAERLLCSQLHLLPGYYLVVKVSLCFVVYGGGDRWGGGGVCVRACCLSRCKV